MLLFKDEFTSALLLSILVTIIVMFTVPSSHILAQTQGDAINYKIKLALKTIVIAFVLCFGVLYFTQEGSGDPMKHIITGEPDF